MLIKCQVCIRPRGCSGEQNTDPAADVESTRGQSYTYPRKVSKQRTPTRQGAGNASLRRVNIKDKKQTQSVCVGGAVLMGENCKA